jgi:hypothetical protein
MILCGCSTLKHGYSATDVAGSSLSTATPEGEQHLQIEAGYDSAVQDLISRLGRPEYLHIVDRENLYLFFTELDRVAVVQRFVLPPGDVQIHERTPGFLLKLLPETEIEAILARRETSDRAKRAKARKTPRARKQVAPNRGRASPAARAPDARHAGVRFSDFDPNRIVDRLRSSLSAADPGVSGWRHAQLADGRPRRIATAGSLRYQVGTDSVSVATPMTPRMRTIPRPTRQGVYRLNQAVFGTRGAAVNAQMEPLVARVAADPSGRTRIHRRVAGRTVNVTRDPERGFLIYAIAAR